MRATSLFNKKITQCKQRLCVLETPTYSVFMEQYPQKRLLLWSLNWWLSDSGVVRRTVDLDNSDILLKPQL